jgi:hypothetical protein
MQKSLDVDKYNSVMKLFQLFYCRNLRTNWNNSRKLLGIFLVTMEKPTFRREVGNGRNLSPQKM